MKKELFTLKPQHATTTLLNEKQAAEILACSVSCLRRWRLIHAGPAYVKIGRLVRYRLTDLQAFIDGNVTRSAA